MSLDVSIYSFRVQSGYLSTTTSAEIIPSSVSPFSSGDTGGTKNVVRTIGDQVAGGMKYWDASAFFAYDVSIAKDLFIGDKNLMPYLVTQFGYRDTSIAYESEKNINQDASILLLNNWNVNQDTSIRILNNWNIGQDSSISTLRTRVTNHDTSILLLNNWDVAQDTSIAWLNTNKAPYGIYLRETSIGTGFKWVANLLEPSIVAISSLSLLTDVSLVNPSTGHVLMFDPSNNLNKWKNVQSVDIAPYFYAKVGNWTLEASGTGMLFKQGGTKVMFLQADGSILVKGNVIQNAGI